MFRVQVEKTDRLEQIKEKVKESRTNIFGLNI